MAIDVFDIVFVELLKISPQLISKYTTVQDQLLYLILVPHVILFLFLAAFSMSVVRRVIGPHHMFELMFSIVGYFFIIMSGWYGTFLVPLFTSWLYIAIGAALVLFLVSVVINPARMKAFGDIFKEAGSMAYKGNKQAEEIDEEIRALKKELRVMETEIAQNTLRGNALHYAQMEMTRIKREIARLEAKRR